MPPVSVADSHRAGRPHLAQPPFTRDTPSDIVRYFPEAKSAVTWDWLAERPRIGKHETVVVGDMPLRFRAFLTADNLYQSYDRAPHHHLERWHLCIGRSFLDLLNSRFIVGTAHSLRGVYRNRAPDVGPPSSVFDVLVGMEDRPGPWRSD